VLCYYRPLFGAFYSVRSEKQLMEQLDYNLLAGHFFGRVLAFEVAHQLQREGISVDMIQLLDSKARDPL
jgi:thioesterase domain-containing protein